MPPVVGHLLFDVYEDGKRMETSKLSERIPSIFDDWQSEFEGPVLDHVLAAPGFSRTDDVGIQKDFLDRVHYVKVQKEDVALPSDLTISYNGKTYVVKFIGFIRDDPSDIHDVMARSVRETRERIAELEARTARIRAESLRRLEGRVAAPPQAWPVGAGAGPAPRAAPASRREDPENVDEEDPKPTPGGRRRKTKKAKKHKKRHTRRK